MVAQRDLSRMQWWLRNRPSTKRWRLEMEDLLSGKREASLMELGSSRQYVRRILADSVDRERAKIAFDTALYEVVEKWLPEENLPGYNEGLIELIIGYPTTNAFQKILGSLAQWGTLNPRRLLGGQHGEDVDGLSLLALESYYPAPPAHLGNEPGFRRYEDLLWSLAGNHARIAHACRRLVELRLIGIEDSRIAEMIVAPGVLEEFLYYALGLHRQVLQNDIGYILAHCLEYRDDKNQQHPYPFYEKFKAITRDLGYELQETPARVFPLWLVSVTRVDKFELLVPPSALPSYIQAASYEDRRAVLPELIAMAEGRSQWNQTT